MLNRIIFWSIHNKLIVAVLTLALIVWGLFSLSKLPIDAVPDITNNQVQVVTSAASSSALDIERFVTFPVEQTMATIPGIEEIRSFSRFGLSVVTIVFSEDTDIYWARQQVQERLSEAKNSIPAGFGEPSMAPLSTGLGEIYQYTLRAKKGYAQKYSPADLRSIQDWVIRRQLLGVKGVADVSGFGGELKTYEIAIDPLLLKAHEITLDEVFTAVSQNNENTGGAYIERHNMTTYIRTEGLVGSLSDIESIQIKHPSAETPVYIRDIATVKYGAQVRYGALTYNAEGEAVGGIVLMLKGANSSEVISLVKERMAKIEGNLPEGVALEVYLDRTNLVNRAINTVSTNLIEGALIVIFVLVLLLGNLRAGLIVASVIPLAMLFAISLMNVFGVSGNLMSLGALDFGLIVDGAVIIVESTLHLLQHRRSKQLSQIEMNHEVYTSASKFSKSAVFGQIIILVVYLPILALVGIEGKMFKPMAQTVIFAILGALILSLIYVPMISSLVLSKKVQQGQTFSDKIVNGIQKRYTPLLAYVLRKQKLVLSGVIVLFTIAVLLFNQLGAEFIPSLDEGDFAVETRLMTGSGLTKTIETTTKASRILLQKFPEIKQVVGKIGTAEIPTDPMPMEACDLMLIFKDKEEWVSADDKEALAAKMQAVLDKELPSVSFGFQQPIQMRFNELMTGAKQDVVVKVYGEDFDKLSAYAKQIGGISSKISGVQDVYVEELSGLPQLIVRYDRDALARYQVSIEEVNRALNLGFAGQIAGFVFEGERKFQLVVKLRESDRSQLTDIEQLYVSNAAGQEIPLAELASIKIENGPNQIQRDDAKRRILVGFNVRGRDVESIVEELQQKMDQQLQFETGYFSQIGGTFENLVHARARLLIAVPISLLLIFFLLYLTFQSVKQAALIYSAIPLASIGGIIALYMRGMPFSISAGVGFIALFGVAVLNGIVLIAEFNSLKKSGAPLMQVVLRGTVNRLRPVLLTATVASLGFLPMALSHGSGAEVQKPLATVVIGGLITATILTLFILPLLYVLFEKPFKIRRKKGILFMAMLSLSTSFFAQQKYTDAQLFGMLLDQNGQIKAAVIEAQRQQSLAIGAAGWQPLSATFMMGQFNSAYQTDNNLTLGQTLPYNGALRLQKEIGKASGSLSEQELVLLKKEFKRALDEQLEQIRLQTALLDLAKKQDTLYQLLDQKMTLRVALGEAPKMDQVLLHSKAIRAHATVAKHTQELQNAWSALHALLAYKGQDFQLAQPEAIDFLTLPTYSTQLAHPSLLRYDIEAKQLQLQSELNRAQQLPVLGLAYFNQSLVGIQNINGTDQYFGPTKRFQGAQIQTQIPIDYKAYKARNTALELALAQNELRKNQQVLDLQSTQTKLYVELTNLIETYTEVAAPIQVELVKLQSDAALQLNSGQISLLDYIQLQDYQLALQDELLQWQHQIKLLHISYEWIKN
ncbi:MAG: CusA/CzcA family heavy metal efflux RND transporter [Crocinitomicaceae bacterium]|nr:CusA/CzcA family heavy metal efflux RND transporter [Crocinitomicaceae bacterium]